MSFLERLGDWIWNPWLLGAFLLLGLYYSIRSGFFQLFEFRLWMSATVGSLLHSKRGGEAEGITQFQALSTALASTIGTGSIAGVATAIFYGGPGAVFWMWISAFLGMMTGCAEKTLAVRYRHRGKNGGWEGGPMDYMEKGLGLRGLALAFSLFCVCASIGGGDMVQANSIATALEAAFGWDRLAVGAVTALLTGLVILGGIGRIGRVSEKLVPAMAVLFLAGGAAVLWVHATAVPAALSRIVASAFAPKAALGGTLGYSMASAMRFGVARGVFTNEAGLGSSAMAHAAADVEEPAEEGVWGAFEVFVATLVVCTVTALVILTSGVYDETEALLAIQSGGVDSSMLGSALSAAAFSTVMGAWGVPSDVCLFLTPRLELLWGEGSCISYRQRPVGWVLSNGISSLCRGGQRGRRGTRVAGGGHLQRYDGSAQSGRAAAPVAGGPADDFSVVAAAEKGPKRPEKRFRKIAWVLRVHLKEIRGGVPSEGKRNAQDRRNGGPGRVCLAKEKR